FTTLRPDDPLRVRWSRAAIAAAVLGLAFVAVKAPSWGKLRDELTFVQRGHDDLVAIRMTRAWCAPRAAGRSPTRITGWSPTRAGCSTCPRGASARAAPSAATAAW